MRLPVRSRRRSPLKSRLRRLPQRQPLRLLRLLRLRRRLKVCSKTKYVLPARAR
jgi:hypothetical protein